ncbi:thioesterase II family protein [Streptomyces sp. NPDC015350]|uniref:thioesterase II family protein n=1 Tax=Streptomyces sp. NPDC015350 TaxID=3364955 RepID=UPI0036F7EC18
MPAAHRDPVDGHATALPATSTGRRGGRPLSLFEQAPASHRWFSSDSAEDEGKPAIVALPFAGGGASFYGRWKLGLPGGVGLICPQPPGRETRLDEPALTSMEEFVSALADVLKERLAGHEYVLFGHSLGAMTAFELAKALRVRGLPEPAHLFVSGANPPQMWPLRGELHTLPHSGLADYLRSFDYMPEEILTSHNFIEYGMPTLRGDLQVCCTYTPSPGRLSCPVSVFYGDDDDAVDARRLPDWADWTSGPCRTLSFSGGHFYLDAQMSLVRDHVLTVFEGIDGSAGIEVP